jgi:hypothetical protein
VRVDEQPVQVTIPPHGIVTVAGALDATGFVDVELDGKTATMIATDILELGPGNRALPATWKHSRQYRTENRFPIFSNQPSSSFLCVTIQKDFAVAPTASFPLSPITLFK